VCRIRSMLRRGWKLKSTGGGCVRLNLASLTPTQRLPASTDSVACRLVDSSIVY